MKKKQPFLYEFLAFIKEYKVATLAVAFIMGEATTGLVNSFVDDIFLPLFAPLASVESWEKASLHLGPIAIQYGSFLDDLLNFIILAFVIFIVAKKIIKAEAENA